MRNTCKFNRVSHYGPEWGSAQVQFTPEVTTTETPTPTSNPDTPGQSGKWYNGLWGAVGEIFKIWQPADVKYMVNNPEKKDNTMLYVGIGGVVLVVVLFLVIALKK